MQSLTTALLPMVLGPDSSLAALILAVVLPLSAGDPLRAVALASMMAVVSGVLCILAGVARLGFVTELLSKPIRYGYMNGIALTVLISQLPKLFGFSVNADDPLHKLWAFFQALLAGKTNPTALLVGGGTLEMVGLGVANLAAGFFQGFPIRSSSSRTPVAEAAGARTQPTSVVGALAVALPLLLAPNLLQYLPNTALAAVVIAAAVGLFEVADLKRIYRIQRWEFWLSIGCAVGVVVLGAIPGIGLAIALAVIEFLWDG